MSMEINGVHPDYTKQYPEINRTEKIENSIEANKIRQDEYISDEKAPKSLSGLYKLDQDEDGNRKIIFDDPLKRDNVSNGVKSANEEDKSETSTTNTDSVDKEIEKLKEEKKQLQQQIRSANGDQEKKDELDRKLAQIESELSQKDNDSYRRQNAVTNVG